MKRTGRFALVSSTLAALMMQAGTARSGAHAEPVLGIFDCMGVYYTTGNTQPVVQEQDAAAVPTGAAEAQGRQRAGERVAKAGHAVFASSESWRTRRCKSRAACACGCKAGASPTLMHDA